MATQNPPTIDQVFENESARARTLFAEARQNIPSASSLAETAINASLGTNVSDKEFLKTNFSELVADIQVAAYYSYLAAERDSCGEVLARMLAEEMASSSATLETAMTDTSL